MNITQKTFETLEFDKIKIELSKYAKFSQSKILCENLLPGSNINLIKQQLQYTKEAKEILDCAKEMPVEYIANISDIKTHLCSSYLEETELINIGKTMRSSRLLKKFLMENSNQDRLLFKLAMDLISDKQLEDRIFDVFDDTLNIKQNATPELKSLYSSLKDTEQNLRDTVNNLLNNPNFSKYLQSNIYTQRDDRIVFQVIASYKTKITGIIHDVSSSSKTLFIEPTQIIPFNNKIREIQSKIKQECIKILVELTELVKNYINELDISEKIMAEIDFHFAKARYSVKIQATEPELTEESGYLYIENMKHPLLLISKGDDVVSNNFEIGRKANYKMMIITGSNTGGKTVTLKTIGLFILMCKSGLFLPCTYAKIYPFENIFADIGDSQNILENLSTFSSHMKNIIEILKKCNQNTFVLLDEICSGTDPVEGAILAKEILLKFANKGVSGVITTHFGELKSLEYANNYFKNASVEFNNDTLQPTYKLLIGIPGLSNAISIASNLGLDNDIITKAKTELITNKDPSAAVVEKLQQTHQELAQNLEKVEQIKENSLNLQKEYEENLNQVKKDKKKTLKNIKNKFDIEMMSARSEIKDILDELRREKSEKIARRAYSRLAKLEENFRDNLDQVTDKQKYIEIDWNKVVVGDILMLKNLHQKVTVISLPDKNKRLTVDMGNIKMTVKQDELAVLDDKYKESKKVKIPGTSFETFELKKYTISQTLDLRGYRVEDALDEVEKYLDKASLANLSPVYIIHGHGTGALKQAIRDFLNTSPYVAKYRPAENSQGGDGVSIVDIK